MEVNKTTRLAWCAWFIHAFGGFMMLFMDEVGGPLPSGLISALFIAGIVYWLEGEFDARPDGS